MSFTFMSNTFRMAGYVPLTEHSNRLLLFLSLIINFNVKITLKFNTELFRYFDKQNIKN